MGRPKDRDRDYIITIDPGLKSMGVAVWDYRRLEEPVPPVKTLLFKMNSAELAKDYRVRAKIQGERLLALMSSLENIQYVGCEKPIFFGGAVGPKTIDDAMTLMFLVGHLSGVVACYDLDIDFEPIPVNEWKGQLPKHLVQKRIIKILSPKACAPFNADVWDAVGVGLYVKSKEGEFKW